MAGRAPWRRALAALLGAVSVAAAVVGGIQAAGSGAAPGAVEPAPARGSLLPGASDPDALVPPAGATVRPPVFAPSAVVPGPAPVAAPSRGSEPAAAGTAEKGGGSPRTSPRDGDQDDRDADDPGAPASRAPSSGETQFEWGCRRGYITEGC